MKALLFLFIFGLGHADRQIVDPVKGVLLHSRIRCDGYGAPQDVVHVHATFAPGSTLREFMVSRYQVDKCSVETMFQCWHKERPGWHELWSAASAEPSADAVLPIASCEAWGSNQPAQSVLSGWYQDGKSGSKPLWQQAVVKQVSSQPEVYEFTDAGGATARLEIRR